MLPDDELCLCFHVSWRKVINYIRVHRIRIPSQLSECQGAGTGCGWCRVFIERLVQQVSDSRDEPIEDLEAWLHAQMPGSQTYSQRRAAYIAAGKQRQASDMSPDDSPPQDSQPEPSHSDEVSDA